MSPRGGERRGESKSDGTRHESAPKQQGDTHDPTSLSDIPSLWLYASADEIAAAVESHRATILRALDRQGFSVDTAERAFELAAGNVYRSKPDVTAGRSLARWLRRTAFHRARELAAREVTAVLADVDPDVLTADDPADEVYARLALGAVLRDVDRLTINERNAILRPIHAELVKMGHPGAAQLALYLESQPPPTRALEYKRLERARARLRRMPRRFIGIPPLTLSSGRIRAIRTILDGASLAQVVGMAVVAVVITSVSSPGGVGDKARSASSSPEAVVLLQLAVDAAIPHPSAAAPITTNIASAAHHRPTPPDAPSAPTAAGLQSPRLPVSDSRVREVPLRPDAPLMCAHNAGPVQSVCVIHPLRQDPSGGDVVRVEI